MWSLITTSALYMLANYCEELSCELDSMLFSCSLSLSKFLCRRLEYWYWLIYAGPFGHFWPSLGGLGRVTIYGNGPKLGSLGLEVFGYDGRHLYE